MNRYAEGPLTCELLRDIVREGCGFDPGELARDAYLDEVDRGGLGRWITVSAIEHRFGIDFPADLMTSLETVDDLLYFTETKVSQRHR